MKDARTKILNASSILGSLMLLSTVLVGSAQAAMPAITGKPVIDTAPILEWKLDQGESLPSLHNPTSNTLYDLHGDISNCDLLMSTEGNYHMALHDIWPTFVQDMAAEHVTLHNTFYTTSPPVFVPQLKNNVLQFDNLSITCKPSIVVASMKAISKLVDNHKVEGDPIPLYQDRGIVMLVKKGNPRHIKTVWDLAKKGVHLVTPNPDLEPGAYANYQKAIYNIALNSKDAPKGMTAEKLIDIVYNGKSKDPLKWLAGARIHHRDEPWSVAKGRADVALILYHLGRYTKETFPDTFDVIPLGGTFEDPQPLPGITTSVRYVALVKGDWTPVQDQARHKLLDELLSDKFSSILNNHGLIRPAK